MGALSWALGAGALGTIAAAFWGWLQLRRAQKAEELAHARGLALELSRAQAQDLGRQFMEMQAQREADRGRLESVVELWKKEFETLGNDMEVILGAGPASVIRSRLVRLSTSTIGGTPGGATVLVLAGSAAGSDGVEV